LEAAREIVVRHIVEPARAVLAEALASGDPVSGSGDYKTALQELLQRDGAPAPSYVLTAETGPDHQRRFHVEVRVQVADGAIRTLSAAEGSSKKQAQQIAARDALHLLEQEQASIPEITASGAGR
jgi:ribonuclease-3